MLSFSFLPFISRHETTLICFFLWKQIIYEILHVWVIHEESIYQIINSSTEPISFWNLDYADYILWLWNNINHNLDFRITWCKRKTKVLFGKNESCYYFRSYIPATNKPKGPLTKSYIYILETKHSHILLDFICIFLCLEMRSSHRCIRTKVSYLFFLWLCYPSLICTTSNIKLKPYFYISRKTKRSRLGIRNV